MNISIITIVLNDLKNLKITFSSLLDQTNRNFEWIIKDGGSSDGIEEFYKSEIIESGLISSFISQKDLSIYDAMNQSIKYANKKYTLFLNAGDSIADKDTIMKINTAIENSNENYSFIYGDNYDIATTGEIIYKKARELQYLKHSLPTSHQAILYRTEILKNYNYSLEFKIAADYALTAKMYFDGYRDYLKLNFPICKFKLGGLSTERRDILLKEGYKIHKEIIKDNFFVANYKLIKRFLTFKLLDKYPKIYNKIRHLSN